MRFTVDAYRAPLVLKAIVKLLNATDDATILVNCMRLLLPREQEVVLVAPLMLREQLFTKFSANCDVGNCKRRDVVGVRVIELWVSNLK